MARLGVAALCLWAVMVQGAGASDQGVDEEQGGRVLAASDFLWDADGWTTSDPASEVFHAQRMIKASDQGDHAWYFVAPPKFLGAKRAAYGGHLSFVHGFFEYESHGRDMMSGFDVILVSEENNLELRLKDVVPAWSFRSEHRLRLEETAGWELGTTGSLPSKLDMLRLLSKLSGIWIRGGFYAGREDTYIMGVELVAGPGESEKNPAKTSLKQQHIVEAGADAPHGVEAKGAKGNMGMFGRIMSGFGSKEKDL